MGKISEALAGCTGSENWFRCAVSQSLLYTDGISLLARLAEAYWMIDLVASHQTKKVRQEPFQLWSLRKLVDDPDHMAVAECRTDTGEPTIVEQRIAFTDFPFDDLGESFEWYVEDSGDGRKVVMLKSER